MSVHDDSYLRNLPKDQLEALNQFLRCKVGCGLRADNLSDEIEKILRQSKGVLVITSCGEEHRINPSQGVREIFIEGKRVFP